MQNLETLHQCITRLNRIWQAHKFIPMPYIWVVHKKKCMSPWNACGQFTYQTNNTLLGRLHLGGCYDTLQRYYYLVEEFSKVPFQKRFPPAQKPPNPARSRLKRRAGRREVRFRVPRKESYTPKHFPRPGSTVFARSARFRMFWGVWLCSAVWFL